MEDAMQCTEEPEVKPRWDDRDTSPQPPRIVESWSALESGTENARKVKTEENEGQEGSSSDVKEERAMAGSSSTAIGVPPEYMRSAFHVDDDFREDVSKRYSELGMEIPERDIKCKQHWKNRRSAARAKKQRKRKEKLANATEEERQAMWEEKQESKRIRNKWVKESIDEIAWEPPHVVIDLSYEYDQVGMCFKELRSLISQVTFAYGALKRAARPMPVHLTSMSSAAGSLIKATEGSASWKFFLHEERYTEVFKDQLENVLYLSPEAEEVLWTVEPDKIYIIGGIVDRNRLKELMFDQGTSLNQATVDGVRTVRLPIQEVLKRPLGNSLNVNHVLDLLLRVRESGDWATVLEEVVPTRKGMRPQGQPGKRQRRLENKAKSSSSGSDEASATTGGDNDEGSGGVADASSEAADASSSGADTGRAGQ